MTSAPRNTGLSLRVAALDVELPDIEDSSREVNGRKERPYTPESPDKNAARKAEAGEHRHGVRSSLTMQGMSFFWNHWEKLVIILGVMIISVVVVFKGFEYVEDVLDWLQQLDHSAGFIVFTVVYGANVSLFLPGLVFILGAGFIFKFWRGLLAVWIGGSFGQAFAFLLGRYLLRDCIVSLGRGRWKKWEVIDKAIELDGWKLVLLLRLSPLVPYNLLNIIMALTRINFWQFALVSSVAIVPECALLVYCGSIAKDVRDVVNGVAGPTGAMSWLLAGVTFVMCFGAAAWATVVVRRAMKRAESHMSLARSTTDEPPQAQEPWRPAAKIPPTPFTKQKNKD